MNSFKAQFSNLSSEYLLDLRARGDGLADLAHEAIEEIFRDRGEYLPAKPSAPVERKRGNFENNQASKILQSVFVIILMCLSWGYAKHLGHSWIGVVVVAAVALYSLAGRVRRNNLSPEQQEIEHKEEIAKTEALTEMMVCAEAGNLMRIRELVEYGSSVNAQSLTGTTALMYAARNNHVEVVQFLLASGADKTARSSKNSTALDIARRFGHGDVTKMLESPSPI
jgi:uncharacterized membrane protein